MDNGAGIRRATYLCLQTVQRTWTITVSLIICVNFDHEWVEHYLGDKKVLLAVEYKPKISCELEDQAPLHLSETLLQTFYLRDRFHHDIVHCLTD